MSTRIVARALIVSLFSLAQVAVLFNGAIAQDEPKVPEGRCDQQREWESMKSPDEVNCAGELAELPLADEKSLVITNDFCVDDAAQCLCAACSSDAAARESDLDVNPFVEQLSDVLATNISDSKLTIDQSKELIAEAFDMVIKNCELRHQTMIAKVEALHQSETALLKGQIVQMSTQATTYNELNRWLSPVYANQNRSYQQLQAVIAHAQILNQTLRSLERQLYESQKNQDAASSNESAGVLRLRSPGVDADRSNPNSADQNSSNWHRVEELWPPQSWNSRAFHAETSEQLDEPMSSEQQQISQLWQQVRLLEGRIQQFQNNRHATQGSHSEPDPHKYNPFQPKPTDFEPSPLQPLR